MGKRTIAFSVLTIGTVVMNAATRVNYVDLPGSGIEMLPGPSEKFNNAITALAGSSTVSLFQSILPYSVIVKNETSSALKMIVVRLDLKDLAGRSVWHEHSLRATILSGEMALITPVGGLNIPMRPGLFGSPPILNTTDLTVEMVKISQRYDAQSGVEVAVCLDSVVFEDGSVVGPDSIHNLERMNLWRDAERSVVAELLKRTPAERIDYLEGIKNAPEKLATRPEEVDQFDFHQRQVAELMDLYINNFPKEVDLLAHLDEFLRDQIPQLHRSIK